MKRVCLMLGWVAGCASLNTTDLGLPPLKSTMVYTGPERVRIELLELGGGDRALIKVDGVKGETTGLVLEHRLITEDSRARWVTQLDGEDWATMWREGAGGQVEWKLRNPEDWRVPIAIQFDEAASKTLDPVPLLTLHEKQRDQGVLSKLATFDRPKNEAERNAELSKEAADTSEKCGFAIAAEIDWASITDDVIKQYSISGYCESGLSGLEFVCASASVKSKLAPTLKKLRCSFAEAASARIEGDTLLWSPALKQTNLDELARNALRTQALGESTIGGWMNFDGTEICADSAKKHFVAMGPDTDERLGGLSYGDGKSMTRLPELRGLGSGWFLDPRQVAKNRNSNFRGYDLRFYGQAEVDDKGACKVTCGEREIPLTRMSPEEKKAFLATATFNARPDVREPYAIARDEKGVYYYVDRGSTPELEKDFRLYLGKRGQLKRQKMKDIVSDSQGEIFSSSSGQLRLIIGRSEAQWIIGNAKKALTLVPVQENLGVIYNELGVYLGAKLFTPCDDL
ncbi:MAG: hypothetical protein HY791_16940 [Deltaproteobacteria bacterium]|nr:hypothetical protein [Deltaproteobacteria bacterium]